MDSEKMIHQANQIAAYFEAYPEDKAREGVLDHIRKFWPPNMRTELVAYKKESGAGLHPLVAWAADNIPEATA